MILHGEFDEETGRPLLEGTLSVPRFRLSLKIPFLVDTGSDRTILSPRDGESMGLDYGALDATPFPSVGIGGVEEGFVEQATLMFEGTDNTTFMYFIPLHILKPNAHLEELPSLLGRGVLRNWHMRYSPPTKTLTFQVASADRTIRSPG